ncbi:putative basal-body rod modification protein FlgD [Candidatus Koribacter versatilis Ellin345]|uniref:Basal-body rod modification protein FlgD n=1 Tax=Koribacter versatilis (strain Ellin345) TaxID=204669 RepID=Q1IR52_KORVE|nr:flagellar hook capping FlgD N-terminal domain-containing protein [Candidatus Koribacter versatilis]ABF40648.1 putative basal-body rod modification protein FlgD [Candidatus Koribacter versatilis Ellin345]
MNITGPAVGQATNAATSGPVSGMGDLDTTFAQLLVAQLKSQDPTSPMDPSQLVSQLVGLNTLDAVTSIYQLLAGLATIPTSSAANHYAAGGK